MDTSHAGLPMSLRSNVPSDLAKHGAIGRPAGSQYARTSDRFALADEAAFPAAALAS